ncbi:ABC transporter permease [Clostridiaceae bacterium M8S5]|nr:ABC transporter permease [Clostridiaceae bacterium M8S5]
MNKNIKIDPKDFNFVQLREDIKDTNFETKPIGFFKDAMIRFCKNKAAIVSFIFIAIVILMAIIGPSFNKYSYREQRIDLTYMPPRIPILEKYGICDGTTVIPVRKDTLDTFYKGAVVKTYDTYKVRGIEMVKAKIDMYKLNKAEDVYFWLGSDYLGRDQWTRLWRGSRISLFIAFLAVIINLIIGVTYGSISAYYGGWTDMIMQRIVEILVSIPQLVIIILFIMYWGAGIFSLAIAMVLTGWVGMNYIIRGQFYKYKRQEYVLASRTMGAKDRTLIFRHILPNAIGPIITRATLSIPLAIFSESFLAYLGLGLQAPEPSIGVLLAEGQKELLTYPYLTLYPAILISILMIAFNLFGNGLRDAFDPTQRGQ